jgi:thiosulfate/3-mercaptopyruvate sulfurtransferase
VINRNSQGPLISVAELAAKTGDDRLRIIDCRFDLMNPDSGHKSYLAGHVPGAVYADLDTDLAAPVDASTGRHPLPDPEVLAHTFRRLGVNRDRPVVVYDTAGGAMAARAWWSLRWLGHTEVRLLDGGLPVWEAAKLPLQEGVVTVEPGDLTANPGEGFMLTTSEVLAGLEEGGDLLLVDARDAARFRGEVEPIDAVAGHIPGGALAGSSGRFERQGLVRHVRFGCDSLPPGDFRPSGRVLRAERIRGLLERVDTGSGPSGSNRCRPEYVKSLPRILRNRRKLGPSWRAGIPRGESGGEVSRELCNSLWQQMKILLKQLVIAVFSSIIVACASGGEAVDDEKMNPESRRSDCISSGTIRDYQVLDDANLIVSGSGNRKYHVALSRRAIGLRSSWKIGFRSVTGRICARSGELVVDDRMGPESIRIAAIRQLTPDEHRELLVRFGKIEPEFEQAPAPVEVESAEVEELD